MSTGKHVIFLGAGASKGSGYPLANDLRLLISSREMWDRALTKYDSDHGCGGKLRVMGGSYWDLHSQALSLFRKGGFATLDEFCKLAGGFQFGEEINGLRCLVRAALGLFNPEEQFQNSEYYGLVQSLFNSDLVTLRKDISILTYNYDPYLEFLLYRALDFRRKVTRQGKPVMITGEADISDHNEHETALNVVTSGFYYPRNRDWLEKGTNTPSFCVLKLHGCICNPSDKMLGFEALFEHKAETRATALFKEAAPTPILFPWEIIGEGGFSDEKLFPHKHSRDLYLLCRAIWNRARREVQTADKISFVGLSMHDFLNDGLTFLFNGKEGKAEIVVANKDTPVFAQEKRGTHWQNHPNSSGYAVSQILGKVAPKMTKVGLLPINAAPSEGEITVVPDFDAFVKTQMKPCQQFNKPTEPSPLVEPGRS